MKYHSEKYNLETQYYKNIPIKLILYTENHYKRLNAKRFMLGDFKYNQNIWIPNVYLREDGSLKSNINIDFIFKNAYRANKLYKAHIDINPFEW